VFGQARRRQAIDRLAVRADDMSGVIHRGLRSRVGTLIHYMGSAHPPAKVPARRRNSRPTLASQGGACRVNLRTGWCKIRKAGEAPIPDSDFWSPASENSSQVNREITDSHGANKKRSLGCAWVDHSRIGSRGQGKPSWAQIAATEQTLEIRIVGIARREPR
jgi:hypothetical protein